MSLVEEARKLLEKRGWCKMVTENERGEHCAFGAVIEARRLMAANHQSALDAYGQLTAQGDLAMLTLATVIRDNYPDRLIQGPDFVHAHQGWRGGDVDNWSVVTTFNNHPDTTKEEVLAVFEKAAAAE